MKLIFPLVKPDVYHNDDKYLAMLAMSTKIHLNDRLSHDGVVFVKDVLEAFSFDISGCNLDLLALAWVSPIRVGTPSKPWDKVKTTNVHDRRYKVKFYVQENKRTKTFPWKYHLVLIVNDKPRKGKKT